MKRKAIRSTGKLKSNAWTVSAVVSHTAKDNEECTEEEISQREAELIQMVSKARDCVIEAIRSEPGLENTRINFIEVDLTDRYLPYYENQLAALGFFATNYVEQHKAIPQSSENTFYPVDKFSSSEPSMISTTESTTHHRRVTIGREMY